MTVSHGNTVKPEATARRPASVESPQSGKNLVGWLIQTAFASVLEEVWETFANPRGFANRRNPQKVARSGLSLNSPQNSLILRVRQRKYKLPLAGRVMRLRRISG